MRVGRQRVRREEGGETLIEILMAVAILGIASVGLIAGLSTNIIASDTHRRLSDVEVVAKTYGEAVKQQVLRTQTTQLTAPVGGHNAGDTVDLTVNSTAGFAPTPFQPFDVAVDTEIFHVISAPTATTFHTTAQAADTHHVGALVAKYASCPVFADVTPSFPTKPSTIQTPTVTEVDYYAKSGSLIASQSTGSATPPAACSDFWNTSPQTCAATGLHVTDCDPALIAVRFSVTSTDVNTERGAKTQTVVLIRRTS